MSKIQTSVLVPVTSHGEAQAKLMSGLEAMNAKLKSQNPNQVVLGRGSQAKMRLLGGSFIKDSDLPVEAVLIFNPSDPTHVGVTVSEHMVVGTTLGIREKYQRACTEFAQLIAERIR